MRYFICSDNRQQGPYSAEELLEHGLSSESLVWAEGMEQWTPAWKVQELRDILGGRKPQNAVTPPPPPQETEAETHEGEDEAEEACYEPERKTRFSGKLMSVAAVAVAVLVLAFTCPGREQHRDAVASEINSAVGDVSGASGAFGILGDAFMSGIVSMVVGRMLDVDNYLVFSVGTIHYGGKSRAVSFGILNHVFAFDAGYLQKSLENGDDIVE